ncbi:MAG: transglutaminase domain-containing protein [Chloroflexi bacterium]|nr:transglutaminase domain-containing protein [Chloroflexota bacterium]
MQTSSTPTRREWDWPSAVIVFLLLQVSAARLVITDWTPYLFFTQTLSAFSVALGLALGYSTFSKRTVRLLAFLYTLVILPWQLTLAVEAEAPFLERLASIGGRLWFSGIDFVTRQPVDDVIFFVTFVSLAFWIVGLTSSFSLSRHGNYLAAILPAGLITVLVHLYDYFIPVRIWGFGIYAFLSLLLLGRLYFNRNRLVWDQKRMFVTAEATQDITNSLLAVTAVMIFVAWSVPISLSSLKEAGKAWRDMTRPIRERLENAVDALESPYSSGSGNTDFYGSSLSLGRNASQGDTPVFNVRAMDEIENKPPRYYWRGRVYDVYNNGQWRSSTIVSRDFAPDAEELSISSTITEQTSARFAFTMLLTKQGLIYMPSDSVWVNRPGNLFSTLTPEGRQDISAWMADPPLSAGDKYQVRALVRNPNILELRSAGTEYPEWVSKRYLGVPDYIDQKIQPLALEITAGAATPYDQAQAITNYLRNEIDYSSTLAPTPKGTDPLLWVLFDSKKGFCMYYASAEVLMLRSLGIPARMVVGFAQGELDERGIGYTVRKADSHAWPEVYFPNIGWVEFEPTTNQDPLARPAAPLPTPTPSGNNLPLISERPTPLADLERDPRLDESGVVEAPPFAETAAGRATFIFLWALIIAGFLMLERRLKLTNRVPVYISNVYARNGSTPPNWVDRWMRWNNSTSIEHSFHAVNLGLRWMGRPQPMYVTPVERAKLLKEVLPSAQPAIDSLLEEHQTALFSPRPGNSARARRSALMLIGITLRTRLFESFEKISSRIERIG